MVALRWSCATRRSSALPALRKRISTRSVTANSPRSNGGVSAIWARANAWRSPAGRRIVIDDGIATGATMRAALRATRLRNPKKLVLAVPVAPTDSLAVMRQEADDVVCLEDHTSFGAIGFYYSDFWQVSDEKVIEILARFRDAGSSAAARLRDGPSPFPHRQRVSSLLKCRSIVCYSRRSSPLGAFRRREFPFRSPRVPAR